MELDTLLCAFEMRQIGIVVDDVHKTHNKSIQGDKGTQSIMFQDGTTVDLRCESTLMTCGSPRPTMKEILNEDFPMYDIAHKLWNPAEYFDEIKLRTKDPKSVNIDTRVYNLESCGIEDDNSSTDSNCQEPTQTFEDKLKEEEDMIQHKYCYHTFKNDDLDIYHENNNIQDPNFHFISNTMEDKSQSTSSLIEKEFDKEDIDYMANIFYSHKSEIEKHSYISPEELKTFYDCPKLEEYHDCNEWDNTMFSS